MHSQWLNMILLCSFLDDQAFSTGAEEQNICQISIIIS